MKRLLIALMLGSAGVVALAASATSAQAQSGCAVCTIIGCGGGHQYFGNDGSWQLGEAHGCTGTSCSAHGHVTCLSQEEEVFEAMASLIDYEKLSVSEIADLLTILGDRAVLSVERSAIQLRSCEDDQVFVAHLPMRREDIKHLADQQQ